MSCGVGHRCGSDVALPWLWHRPAAVALIRPLAWELLYATPAALGGSQARGQIRAVAPGLHDSHSNARSELYLPPTPQLMATLDP